MRRLLRFLVAAGLVAATAIVTAAVPLGLVARRWAGEAIELADRHARYEAAHPGWSFPARVRTAPTPLDAAPGRLLAEARARGYVEDCADPGPGELCSRTKTVVPRDGDSLEPIELGWLIGPDGELRIHLPLDEAPRHLVDAILVAEDRAFRDHSGVNPSAMARAVLANAQEGGYSQGASTLTMQVVRTLSQRREKTILRKLREAVEAVAIDRHLGKDGVLQMYLDAPYLGQRGSLSICGFEAAALHYFGKAARDLDLAEAATLAAILPAPARYAPDTHPERARERRDRVLEALATHAGYDVQDALATPVTTVRPEPFPERYPAYLSATRAWLEQRLPPETLYGAGLVVTVGLDVHAQEESERLFPAKTRYYESLLGRRGDAPLEAAAILMDNDTGLIRAIYGGSDVTPTSFNRATQARRQPGSAFKPLVYALAFTMRNPDGSPRFTSAHTEPNERRVFATPGGDWSPGNVGGQYSPTATLAQALAQSQNIATVGLLVEMGGQKPLIAFAQKLGFDTSAFPDELGVALGTGEATLLEMGQFAAIVANGGREVRGSPVLRAVDPAGVERVGPPEAGAVVLDAEAAALTRELMRVVVEAGSGSGIRGRDGEAGYTAPSMGKTGTTDDERDLWFVGATPTQSGVVWLGYDTPVSIGGSAADLAAPLWGWWMGRITKHDEAPASFQSEPEVVRRWMCAYTGKGANDTCRVIPGPFLPGTEPKGGCPIEHPPEVKAGPQPRPGYESLWRRLERERAEAAGGLTPLAPPSTVTPP